MESHAESSYRVGTITARLHATLVTVYLVPKKVYRTVCVENSRVNGLVLTQNGNVKRFVEKSCRAAITHANKFVMQGTVVTVLELGTGNAPVDKHLFLFLVLKTSPHVAAHVTSY